MKYEDWEKRLMRMIYAQENGLGRIFNEFISETSPLLQKYKSAKRGGVWHRNKTIEAQLDRKLIELQEKLSSYLNTQSAKAWDMANKKTDKFVSKFIGTLPISDITREGLFAANMDALKAFQARRVGNMSLSDRVWKICEQTKENFEFYLQSGIGTGRSAANISMDVRQLLNNPDKRFRRIRDPETGKLKPSKPMAAYHPGAGVYRSAYQNALRMTRTETNMAYRLSDQARWQKLDFVTGYEVKLSASHIEYDICDEMKGQYPKSFVFNTWHPNCYCYTIPVTLNRSQFADYLVTDKMPVNPIKTIPGKAQAYVKKHSKQFQGWKNPPYWLGENFTLKDGKYVPRKGLKVIPEGVIKSSK